MPKSPNGSSGMEYLAAQTDELVKAARVKARQWKLENDYQVKERFGTIQRKLQSKDVLEAYQLASKFDELLKQRRSAFREKDK